MTDEEKAQKILIFLESTGRITTQLTVENILEKATGSELDFYYRWCCE